MSRKYNNVASLQFLLQVALIAQIMNDGHSEDISVLCVDDNVDITSILQHLVASQPGMCCVGCIDDPDRLIDEVARAQPRIVLLDLSIPGVDTIDLIRTICRDHPDCRVLVYSGYDDPDIVDEVIQAGAWGLVSKQGDFEGLIEAIRRVEKGEVVLPNA